MTVELVPTSSVKHLKYPFKAFNPAQSLVFPHKDEDVNIICASPTGSGKTEMSELVMDSALRQGKKAIYTSPLKAISQEKLEKWKSADHGFSKYTITEITGDVKLSEKQIEALKDTDIVVMTSEALDARCRRMESERNQWLKEVGALVVDEVHLITMERRGDRLESSLIRFTKHNPDARLVFLSATVENYEELGRWAARLNGKETRFIKSDYRPCPLNTEIRPYPDVKDARFKAALALLKEHKRDRFIIFVHTKPDGRRLVERLRKLDYKTDFHNSERDRETRKKIEDGFRSGKLDVLVSTSTLAYGINLPARRVIIYGANRGKNFVDPIDILQECGRAGRMGFDDAGDAYILVPQDSYERHRARLAVSPRVQSQMANEKTLAFHLVSEIEQGNIRTDMDVQRWFERSLAYFQGTEITVGRVQSLVNMMADIKAIHRRHDGYHCLPVGLVASWFYLSPFDVAAWARNFDAIFSRDEPDDFDLAWAITFTDTNVNDGFMPADHKEIAAAFAEQCYARRLPFHPNITKPLSVLLTHILGKEMSESYKAAIWQVRSDVNRTVGAIRKVVEMTTGSEPESDFWDLLALRIEAGVNREMLPLIEIQGVGRGRARKLFDRDIRTLHDIEMNSEDVEKILGPVVGPKVVSRARKILRERMKEEDK